MFSRLTIYFVVVVVIVCLEADSLYVTLAVLELFM